MRSFSIRAVLAIFALIALAAIGADSASAAPPDFTWSSTVSTAQAGGHPNLSLNYRSSSAQSLTQLDVDLPAGMMNNPSSAEVCSAAGYRTGTCTTTTRAGSASSQIVVLGRLTVSLNGSIHRLSTEGTDADAVYGISFNTPLSLLGVSEPIRFTDAIRFRPGGGLRHSITSTLGSIPIVGGVLRLSQLNMQFLGRQPSTGGYLLSNPTSCRTQPFTATGTFSDGSSRAKTSSFTTNGCPAVPFGPGAEFSLANDVAGESSGFSHRLTRGTSSSALSQSHISSSTADLSELGDLDADAFEALATCNPQQLASPTGCPAASRLGTIGATIEGFDGARGGAIYRLNSPGHKTVGEITLRSGAVVVFGGAFEARGGGGGGGGAGGLLFTTDGMPQLPFTSLRFSVTQPLLKVKERCVGKLAHFQQDSFSGGHSERHITVLPAACRPVVKTIDPLDADDDGDGVADQPFRGPDFRVRFSATDGNGDLDESKLACSLTDPKDPARTKGRVVVIKDGEGGFACQVGGADSGDALLTISAPDLDGHVTVLKLALVIDTSPPSIAIDESGVHFSADPSVSIAFSVSDDSLFSELGFVDVSCERKGWDGTIKGSAKIITDRDTGRSKGFCSFTEVPEGSYKVTVRGWDPMKKEEFAETDLVVDTTPPSIAIDEPGVQFTGDPDFDLFSAITITETNPYDAECSTGDLDGDGAPDFAPCGPGVPVELGKKGLNAVNVSLVDRAGNEGSAVVDVFLDTEAPSIAIDEPGVQIVGDPDFDLLFAADDDSLDADGPLTATCERKGWDGTIKGSSKLTKADAGRALDGSCSFTGVADGSYEVELSLFDSSGHVTVLKLSVVVDTTPPSIAIDESGVHITGDPDFDLLFTATDAGSGIDESKLDCAVTDDQGKLRGKGIVKGIGSTGHYRCAVTDAIEGDSIVVIRAVDYRGHVTVLKHSVTVDFTPPGIAIDEQGVHFTGDPDFDMFADMGVTIDGKSESAQLNEYRCTIVGEADLDGDGDLEQVSKNETLCGETDHLRVLPTVNKITVDVADLAGNTSSSSVTVYLDLEAPSIAIDESGVHITGDPDFDLLFTADDNSLDLDGPLTATCERKGWDGTVKGSGKLTKADAGRAMNGSCSFTGVADGEYEVELSVFDASGHVTVLKHSVEVDSTLP